MLASHDGLACSPKASSTEHPASRARPVRYPGRRSTGVETDGATDAQEVDVPAHDEQRVRNAHDSTITRNRTCCPGYVRHVDGADVHMLGHMPGNRADRAPIPVPGPPPAPPALPAPGRIPRRRRFARRTCGQSALADPAERRLGAGGQRFRRRLVLAVAPRAARAVLMMVLPAWNADHAPIVRANSQLPALMAIFWVHPVHGLQARWIRASLP